MAKLTSKEDIKNKLLSIQVKIQNEEHLTENDYNWLVRSLMAIYNGQTSQEKVAMVTVEHNGIGFNGVDATILTSYAEQWRAKGWLSRKQFAIVAKKMPKYAGQLAQLAAAAMTPPPAEPAVITEVSSTPMSAHGFYKFPNGAEVHCGDFVEERNAEGEVIAWNAWMDGVKYTMFND